METAAVWEQFSESLKAYIFSRVKNDALTNDLLQDVFIKIHLNIHSIKKEDSLKSWIYTITNNTIVDFYKKQSKPLNIVIETDSFYTETNEHSAKDCLLPLINNLPNKYKEALLLSEIKGLKQAKVAEILNISLSGAKSRIQRGRNLLKQGFIDCCDYKLNNAGHLVGEHKAKNQCNVCSS